MESLDVFELEMFFDMVEEIWTLYVYGRHIVFIVMNMDCVRFKMKIVPRGYHMERET